MLSTFFFRHPRLRLGALLAAPLGWLVVIYLGSLVLLLLACVLGLGAVHGRRSSTRGTLDNFRTLVEEPVYRDVAVPDDHAWPLLVTVADAVLAFPIAYYMARVASPRTRNILVVAVLTPLWASYLVKAYTWRTILGEEGVLNWLLAPFGLDGPGLLVDRALARVHVSLAAVHDPPGLRRARADPAVAARGVGRSRRRGRCGRSGR